MRKKLRYPEYINGIKQEQNPIKRLWISIWYSGWFRCFFVICPVWLLCLLVFYIIKFPQYPEMVCLGATLLYGSVFTIALFDNDFSKLNRIGLDENHKPLKVNNCK